MLSAPIDDATVAFTVSELLGIRDAPDFGAAFLRPIHLRAYASPRS